jgi:hypothetical protein
MTDGHRTDSGNEADHGNHLPVRLGVLLVLAVAGLGLAGAGIALGVGDPLDDSRDNPEIAVTGDNITVVTSDHERTTVMDMTRVRDVEITVTDDEFRIQAEREPPLSDDERERATGIVRSNETVMDVVGEFDEHEVSVQPAGSQDGIDVQPAAVNASPDLELDDAGGVEEGVDVHLAAVSSGKNSVKIRRQTTSDGQTAVVTILDTGTGAPQYSLVIDSVSRSQEPRASTGVEQYSLVVDLVTERVVDLESERHDG